ncbi:MAG: hypothetical protein GF384_07505 [Elusimicrobia bacterium]|nr:hypothetical protein [Elusimicrobiota bacterium]MBD3412496.1 hypothetical protein [Elusimicrobiota bacterium]
MYRRRFLAILGLFVIVGIGFTLGYLVIGKKDTIQLELSMLDKSYRHGQSITLNAVLRSQAITSIDGILNARLIGDNYEKVLQTYFPRLKRNVEYTFEFKTPVSSALKPGTYRLLVRLISGGSGSEVEDLVNQERTFTVRPKRKLTAKEIATIKAQKSGKGIPLDADLALYPIETSGSWYGEIMIIGGVFRNITYWDGDYKLVVTITDPAGEKTEMIEKYRIKSGEQQEFSFDVDITTDMAEGRYPITVKVFDDRAGKKQYGRLINETATSFSLQDLPPELNLDAIELSIPGDDEYDFKVQAYDDRGIETMRFQYRIERKGIIENINILKKNKVEETVPMILASGDRLDGVWVAKVMMPNEGDLFSFSVKAEDSDGHVTTTEYYPVSVTKRLKKKKEEKKDEDIKYLPGFQGYDEWGY